MSKYHEGQFLISGGSDDFWTITNAKTLMGAKALATRSYQPSVGGKIVVGQVRGLLVEVVAIRYGFASWSRFP